jgi:RNAse (barnase) inhibitor barstar
VRDIASNLAGCTTPNDVFERILDVLDAPDWHGRNLDALWDSVPSNEINGVRAPYRLKVAGYVGLGNDLRELVDKIGAMFAEARRDRLIEVDLVAA